MNRDQMQERTKKFTLDVIHLVGNMPTDRPVEAPFEGPLQVEARGEGRQEPDGPAGVHGQADLPSGS
jgi:hypothetical protein